VSSFSESFIASGKKDGAVVLREGRVIVTGETCVPASLNNLGEAAVLHFPLL
jgi:deoxycytidylate deaminase